MSQPFSQQQPNQYPYHPSQQSFQQPSYISQPPQQTQQGYPSQQAYAQPQTQQQPAQQQQQSQQNYNQFNNMAGFVPHAPLPGPNNSMINPNLINMNLHAMNMLSRGQVMIPGGIPPRALLATPAGLPFPPGFDIPSPLSPDVEELKDPRLEDPWFQDFVKRHTASQTGEWLPSNVKERLRELQENADTLKAIVAEMKQRKGTDPSFKILSDQAKILKEKIDNSLGTFTDENPDYLKFKARVLRARRHKTWLQKARERVKENKKQEVEKKDLIVRIIDEWQNRLISEAFRTRQAEAEKKKKKLEEKKKLKEKRSAVGFADVLMQMEELRALRANNLELEGQPLPATKSLYDILQQYLKENPFPEPPVPEKPKEEKTKQNGENQPQVEPNMMPMNTDNNNATNANVAGAVFPKVDDVTEYYNQAYKSIEKLITIRRAWDLFVVPPGFGTRIPPSFVIPPTIPHKKWKKYLRKKKRTVVKKQEDEEMLDVVV